MEDRGLQLALLVGGEVRMPGRDIIVIRASARGLVAFRTIVAALPSDLPATLVLVQHMSLGAKSAPGAAHLGQGSSSLLMQPVGIAPLPPEQ